MMSRTLFICLLSVALAYAAPGDSEVESTRDLIACNSKPGDVALVDLDITDEGHYLGKVSIDVKYPSKASAQTRTVNCVKVHIDSDSSGKATITDGGLGLRNVSLHLESSFTKGATFSVQIFGH